jgi:hypothetical protein
VLGDGYHWHVRRCDAGEVEEVTQFDAVQGALVAGDGVDDELDAFELPAVEEREDRVAQPSLVGLGSHRSGSGDLEAEAVIEVGVDGSLQDVAEVVERSSPGRIGVLGRSSLRAQPGQQRLPTLQRPRAGGGDDHEPGQQSLMRDLLAEPVQRRPGAVRPLTEVLLECGA